MIAYDEEIIIRGFQNESIALHLAFATKPKTIGREVRLGGREVRAALALEVVEGVLSGDSQDGLWLVGVKG